MEIMCITPHFPSPSHPHPETNFTWKGEVTTPFVAFEARMNVAPLSLTYNSSSFLHYKSLEQTADEHNFTIGYNSNLPSATQTPAKQPTSLWSYAADLHILYYYRSLTKKGPVSNIRPPPIIASISCKGLKFTPKSAHPIDLMRKVFKCNMMQG